MDQRVGQAIPANVLRARTQGRRSLFYPLAALVMLAIMLVGFAPSFFLRPAYLATPLPAYIIAHGVVMTGWQGFYALQAWLVFTGRGHLHRQIGWIGGVLAAGVFVSSIVLVLLQPARLAAAGIDVPDGVPLLVISSLFGRVTFAVLVVLAIRWRRRPAIHARLMFWAALTSVAPALSGTRMVGDAMTPYFPTSFPPQLALLWLGWIALLLNDWHETGRIHPASVIPPIAILFVEWSLVDYAILMPGLVNLVAA